MIGLTQFYFLAGLMFLLFGVYNLLDQRRILRYRIFGFLFWLGYSLTFLCADIFSDFAMGWIVIGLAVIAGFGLFKPANAQMTQKEQEFAENQAKTFKNYIFIPALLVPILTLAGTFIIPHLDFFHKKSPTLVALGISAVVAFVVALLMFKTKPTQAMAKASDTMDSIGWAALLPQTLAALGAIFASVGMGDQVANILSGYINLNTPFVAVATYTFSMAIFTMIMGNAFAAFPVMTAAIAYPILIVQMGANPAVVGAIGMLSGFCGTLLTPMAANFNIVPVALLNLKDKFAVIKAQFVSSVLILIANTLLMYFLAF